MTKDADAYIKVRTQNTVQSAHQACGVQGNVYSQATMLMYLFLCLLSGWLECSDVIFISAVHRWTSWGRMHTQTHPSVSLTSLYLRHRKVSWKWWLHFHFYFPQFTIEYFLLLMCTVIGDPAHTAVRTFWSMSLAHIAAALVLPAWRNSSFPLLSLFHFSSLAKTSVPFLKTLISLIDIPCLAKALIFFLTCWHGTTCWKVNSYCESLVLELVYENQWQESPWRSFLVCLCVFIIILQCGHSPKNDRYSFWAQQPVNTCQCLMSSSCQTNSCGC